MIQRSKARIERVREAAKRKGKGKGTIGTRSKVARREVPSPAEQQAWQAAIRQRVDEYRAQVELAPNVLANNRATDVVRCNPGNVLCSTQGEESIAAWRQYVLVAWNDGEKADPLTNPPPANDVQGYAFSADSGASFTDGGVPPKGTNWTWVSDPIVTVNEKTGTFYFVALVDSTPFFNGIGIVPATFVGTNIAWGAPVMLRKVGSGQLVLDKPWAVADSSSDSLHVSYTTFTQFANHIQYQRSPNGVSWAPALTVSLPADSGWVQGSRPAVGPNGEVYVVWSVIGPIDVDYFRIRKSTNYGVSFGTEIQVPAGGVPSAGFYGNWGMGAPGFNRERGISFPGISVDRSSGPYRGRVYVTWNESINFYDDYLNTGPGANSEPAGESGANNTPATARAFTVNNFLRGAIGAAGDVDYWSFTAAQGQTGVFFLDSLNSSLDVSFRLMCSDQVTQLGYSNFSVGGGGFLVFTFPAAGTYYLRCFGFDNTTGGYRIHTKFSVTGPERARDHRDVFVTSSNNGVTAWSTPLRINVDAGYYDNWLPEVAISGQGRAFIAWYDWRDSPAGRCGGLSHVYLARSDDGGSNWIQLGQVTSAQSDWTNSSSFLAPNQGDYIGLYANENGVYAAWADARNADPDVYMSYLPLLVTPVQASLLSAEATPQRVSLAWHASGAENLAATVYRRTDSSDWTALATLDVPANGRIVYEDEAVTPGARYGYRVGVVEGGVESYFGEAWVQVPAAVFEISSVAPNPASRDLWVSFSLPSAAPATLRLIDVAGRSVRTREMSAAAGPQRVNLGDGVPLPAGVYVVKLTQGGRSVSARVSVVR
jgi:hypothetical protein